MPDRRAFPPPVRRPFLCRGEPAQHGSYAGLPAGPCHRRRAVWGRGCGAPWLVLRPGRVTGEVVGILVIVLAGIGAGGCGGEPGPRADGRGGDERPSAVVGSEPGVAARPAGPGGVGPDGGGSVDHGSVDREPRDPDRCAALDRFSGRVGEAAAVVGDPTRGAALAERLGSDLAEVGAAPEDLRHALAVWRGALLELGAVGGGPDGAPPAASWPSKGSPADPGSLGAEPSMRTAQVAAVLGRPEVAAAIDRIERDVRAGCP